MLCSLPWGNGDRRPDADFYDTAFCHSRREKKSRGREEQTHVIRGGFDIGVP